jgi:hypothetical protein
MITSAEEHRRPPPRAKWRDLFPLRRAFGSDARAIMVHLARSYGPFVRTRLPMHIYFVSGPALIEEILPCSKIRRAFDPSDGPTTRSAACRASRISLSAAARASASGTASR